VGIIAVIVARLALATGHLGEWMHILWFETGPEHYQNNQEAAPLLERPLAFYTEWARLMGFGALGKAALLAWAAMVGFVVWADRHARWILASVLLYSLLLCTIDHFPSHYFLPLVAGMGISMAVATRRVPRGWARETVGLALAVLVIAGAL
jgi:hypothetical protein